MSFEESFQFQIWPRINDLGMSCIKKNSGKKPKIFYLHMILEIDKKC